MPNWFYIPSSPGDPAWNMALDEALLESASKLGAPVLRFYGWSEPSATFGYFQKYQEIAAWTPLRPLIRRPTGGGLVPHERDWTYSVVIPPSDPWYRIKAEDSYCRVHQWVKAAFNQLRCPTELAQQPQKEIPGQCFAGAEKFDLLSQGRKIAGAAQRRNQLGLLIQGSVQELPPGLTQLAWQEAMLSEGGKSFDIQWTLLSLSEHLQNRAQSLKGEKYSRPEYNQRR